MYKKPIIVFEGIEGSGKTYHINSISNYLKKKKIKFIKIREPGGSKNSEKIGMKIMTTVGGSSGALFATLLMGMAKKYSKELNNLENLAAMFYEGVEATKKRGKADLGEKTMLDVLIPVSLSLNKLKNEKNIKIVAEKIKMVAKEGMLSTRDIMATKGRASFLGERAIGHIDPGARSSQLAISAICVEYIN